MLWLWLSATSLQAQQNVVVSENRQTGFIEIKNGLLGIVVPSSAAYTKGKDCPAPVQSFIYSDGTASDNTVNHLQSVIPVETMKTTIISNAATKAVVQVEYIFSNQKNLSDKNKALKKLYYTFRVQVKKNEKTIVIEEDATTDVSYSVKISRGLEPDKARYRGWSSDDLQNGYEPSGGIYRSEDVRQFPLDATVDLNYQQPFSYKRLVLWEPAGGEQNSGRYWQVFNSGSKQNANLFGFFQGQPQRLIGARHVGPQLQTLPADRLSGEKAVAEIAEIIELRSPDNITLPRKRFQWIAYISTKKDVLSPEKTQPIGMELNRVAGLGAVIKDYVNKPVKLIPAFYKAAIYMSADKVARLCTAVKTDKALYDELLQTEGGYQQLWDMWHSPQKAKEVLVSLLAVKRQLETEYVSGEGSYTRETRYWKSSRNFKYYAILISCLFADKTITISAEEKMQLEQFIGMMARILWDDNNAPMFDSSGVNFGPSNMIFQYLNNGRYFFALLLKDDPEFAERAKQVARAQDYDIDNAFAANGASFGSPHYTQATVEPILFSLLQLKHAGLTDLFKENKKIKSFARFYLSLLTPPSCRFSGNRKLISFGDGSEESAACFALLATGFADVDPALSKELMTAYNYGPQRSSFHGLVRLAADINNAADKSIKAGTANYNGYVTHYRSGINTNAETAVWMLNGDALYDHRNDDAGEIAIYALGAPLSLSRSSFYNPSATDARIRSVVVPEKLFPEWNGNQQPIEGRSLTNRTWPSSSVKEFAALGYSNSSTVLMKTTAGAEWHRQLMMIDLPGNYPVIVYYDSIKGNAPNIWSMMMMSEGPVGTAAGNILPEQRIHNNADLTQLPRGTPVKTLAPGINRFAFTGQPWKTHTSGGINWYLYTISENRTDFSLADWTTTWQNQKEQQEFAATNQRAYSEQQQIIRLKSATPFFNLLLPYFKGNDPYASGVERTGGDNAFRIKLKNQEIMVGKNGYYMKGQQGFVMASWSSRENMEHNGYGISGGYTEIENKAGKLTVRVHGNAGKRTIRLPFVIQAVTSSKDMVIKLSAAGSSLMIDYGGGSLNLASGEKGYKEYIFTVKSPG